MSFITRCISATATAIVLALALSGPGLAAEPPGLAEARDAAARQGAARVIVELDPGPAALAPGAAVSDFVRRSTVARTGDLFVGRIFGSDTVARQRGLRRAANLPVVTFSATVDDLGRLAADPSVARVHLDRPARRTLSESTSIIGMPAVWAAGADGSNTVVAVLDTGVSSNHPFLAGKVVAEACFSTAQTSGGYTSTSICPNGQNTQTGAGSGVNCSVASYGDGCKHGTHVAGIAAGANASLTPANGVARSASIFAVQVFSFFPAFGDVLSWSSDQIQALDHLYSQRNALLPKRIVAVNMSLGGGSYSSPCTTDPLRPAVQLLQSAGIRVVAAAGNDGFIDSMSAPACIPEVVSVGSTTKSDTVSVFSNTAATTTLLAPGSAIVSSVPGGGFESFNGTSMATPHVAGAIAALADGLPAVPVDDIVDALVATGLPIADVIHTKNRIRVDAAYQSLAPATANLIVSPTGAVVIRRVGATVTPTAFSLKLRASAGTVDWSMSGLPAWLRASATGGTVGTTGTTVTFTVVPPGGQTADLKATLVFRKAGSSATVAAIPVTLDFVPQELRLSALTDTTVRRKSARKAEPAIVRVRVASSVGVAKWRVTGHPSWLVPDTTSGSAAKGGSVVKFRVDLPKRQSKTLTGKITFAIPGVKGTAESVSVRLEIDKGTKKTVARAED
jgi:subtilisin family serine protease